MTTPATDRHTHERQLFADLFDRIGDRCIDDVWFAATDPAFAIYLPTTWQALRDRGLLAAPQQRQGETWSFKLATPGWQVGIRGLDPRNKLWSSAPFPDDVKARLTTLCESLKAQIKGRKQAHPLSVPAKAIEQASVIGRGWIQNCAGAGLLGYAFQDKEMRYGYIDGGDDADLDAILIPATFGHPTMTTSIRL